MSETSSTRPTRRFERATTLIALCVGLAACSSNSGTGTDGAGVTRKPSTVGDTGGVSPMSTDSGAANTGGSTVLLFTGDAASNPTASGAGGTGGAGNTIGTGTLPPGFTMADVGGYMLGNPINPDAGVPAGIGGASGSTGDAGSLGGCGNQLLAVVRDFHQDHVNFEGTISDDRGVVETTLGADGKPVYASTGPTKTISGPAAFNQFYRDVPGVNDPYVLNLWFEPNNGVITFHSSAFFPLDGEGFGDEGNPHNFHFTTEVHTKFKYNGGETFTFEGDDDLWVFIHEKLAIDLGGVHDAETASVDLDARAAEFGIEKGKIYALDLFHAERHTTQSNFRVDTDLAFVTCGTIVPEIH
jgi:fibro-slime domain-containing protein